MRLQQPIQNVFIQLTASLNLLDNDQYMYAGKTLSNATIGQHVRHIIEMFICLEDGYAGGVINYENRKRDSKIETDKDFAVSLLKQIYGGLHTENKQLILEAAYDESTNELLQFDTNYYREIAYNLEHTIHHMALIKVGIREVSDIEIPDEFGVASSTIKFRAVCAQ
ncbi:MAG: DinB family protein [Bacteroidota bacterium]